MITSQRSAFELAVRDLLPGREYPLDRLLTLCRRSDPRVGFSTVQSYLHEALASGTVVRIRRGVYAVPDAQGGMATSLLPLSPSDPNADTRARLIRLEEGLLLCTQQQVLLDRKLDHVLTLLRQISSQGA